MKKLITIILFVITEVTIGNAQFTKAGGGIALSNGFPFHQQTFNENRSGILAISLEGIYEITLPIHIAPSFTIFYPHITKDEVMKTTVSSMFFDINGHYVINSLDRFEFYGLAGLDILFTRKKTVYSTGTANIPEVTERDNALGLNLGVGTYIKIAEQFDIFGEAKYTLSKYDQFIICGGILMNIDWMKKHENTGL
jgi:hypothetical protein